MDDPLIVRRLDYLAQSLEQRNELVERERRGLPDEVAQRRSIDELHRDPHDSIVFDSERVHVRRVRVIEARREPSFAYEPLRGVLPCRQGSMNDLDDRGAAEPALLGAVDGSTASLPEDLSEHEVTQDSSLQHGEVVRLCGRAAGLMSHVGTPVVVDGRGAAALVAYRRRDRIAGWSFVTTHAVESVLGKVAARNVRRSSSCPGWGMNSWGP